MFDQGSNDAQQRRMVSWRALYILRMREMLHGELANGLILNSRTDLPLFEFRGKLDMP